LATGTWDGAVHIREAATGKERYTFQATEDPVLSVVLSADGRTLVARDRQDILTIWDVSVRRQVGRVSQKGQFTEGLLLAPDGRSLVYFEGSRLGWLDVRTGRNRRVLKADPECEFTATAFSPDGRLLAAAGSDGKISLWDLGTGA